MSYDQHHQISGTFIQHLINQGFSRHRPVAHFDDFEVSELDLTRLKLNVGWFVPFIVPRHLASADDITSTQISKFWRDVERHLRGHQKIKIIVVDGYAHLSEHDPSRVEFEEKGVVIWDKRVMRTITHVDDPHAKFKLISKGLLDVVGRGPLSPYVSGRPALGGRFFGRSTHLRHILSSESNCTILGNRRIGKTSLLKEIKERLKLRGYRTAEVYGATVRSNVDFVTQLLNELGEYRNAQQVVKNKYHATSLPRWIKHIATKDPVAVFVDELDHILELDAQQGHVLTHMLREIFESNAHCRIFFAGFRRVMSERQNLGSPLFNFTRPIELQGFSREETYEMVVKPLSHLGIDVEHSDLPTHIYLTTAGQPEHIQIFCAELISFYEENNRIPQAEDLVRRVMDSTEYKQKVRGAFLSNTNSYEELLCYLLIAEAESSGQHQWYEFGPLDVNRVLKTVGKVIPLRDIMSLSANLMVSGIIQRVPGDSIDRYRFSSPLLMEYLSNLDLNFCIEKALEKIQEYDLYVYDTVQEDPDI